MRVPRSSARRSSTCSGSDAAPSRPSPADRTYALHTSIETPRAGTLPSLTQSPITGSRSLLSGEQGSIVRTILLSIIGFAAPVCLALVLVPTLYPDKRGDEAPVVDSTGEQSAAQGSPGYSRGALAGTGAETANGPAEGAALRQNGAGTSTDGAAGGSPADPGGAVATLRASPPSSEGSSAYLTVASHELLDPADGKIFIISARFTLESLPKVGKRSRIAMKYDNRVKPYPGWALAIRRFDTSIRPEMYWESGDGKGGWLTFDHVSLKRGTEYNLTLLARGRDLMSIYLEELSAPPAGAAPAGDDDEDDSPAGVRGSGVVFAGGYPLNDMNTPRTGAPLYFAPQSSRGGEFRGSLHELLVAQVDEFPLKRERLSEELHGGTKALIKLIEPGSRSLWVTEQAGAATPKDSSAHQFPISISEVKP